jgi:hypothetical protein
MKFLLVLLLAMPLSALADCVKVAEKDGQRHFSCVFPGSNKVVELLDLKGSYEKTAYYHGLFLQKQIEDGVLNGIRIKSNHAFASIPKKDLPQFLTIKDCVIDKYRSSATPEFKAGLVNMHRGMVAAGSKVNLTEFENLNYMVEFSGFADTLQRKLEMDPAGAKRMLFGMCGARLAGAKIGDSFRKLVGGLQGLKLGCTGVASSATHSRDGALVLGRNFDTGLLGYFEKHPMILIQEYNGQKMVGIASAGLHFAGGISGFNTSGLVASLHELRTDAVAVKHEKGTSDIMPALLHKVLMQAKNLDQAIAMIRANKGFGAWTIFIGDTKTDEIASVEISGDIVSVARRSRHQFMAQSNHFIAPDTSLYGYEYSMNKTLESHARFNLVTESLTKADQQVDAQWVINMLSGHEDYYVGQRSFGRTTTKVYTAATHVMVPARQEWWMSLQETYPTNLSSFVGLRLSNGPVPIEVIGETKAARAFENADNWYRSMGYYVDAWKRAQEDNETLMGANIILDYLKKAQDTALLDNVYEYPYHFMGARMLLQKSAYMIQTKDLLQSRLYINQALAKFAEVEERTATLHPYESLQLKLWTLRGLELLEETGISLPANYNELKASVREDLSTFRREYPRQHEIVLLQESLGMKMNAKALLDIDVHFETVE